MKNLLILSFLVASLSANAEYNVGDIIFGSTESPDLVISTSDDCYETIHDILYNWEATGDYYEEALETLETCGSDGATGVLDMLRQVSGNGPDSKAVAAAKDFFQGYVVIVCCDDGVNPCITFVPQTCATCEPICSQYNN